MTKTTKIRSQMHKTLLKTHIEALKIQKFSRGRPPNPLTRGGIIPLSCSPPLVPSTLYGFLRRTTFKYAATALQTTIPCYLRNLVKMSPNLSSTAVVIGALRVNDRKGKQLQKAIYTEGLYKRSTCLNANLCRKLNIFIM